jgi:acyl-CoA hydrolase
MSDPSARSSGEVTLRFLAAPTDVAFLGGSIQGGKVLEWIDKAGYACAVGWSRSYCVTAYVGDVQFDRPIESGHLVEVSAQVVHTGRSSMHIHVVVSSADPKIGRFTQATECVVIFVAVGDDGRSILVPKWVPGTRAAQETQRGAVSRIEVRHHIEAAMAEQTYTEAGTAPRMTLRFMANPTDVNWGGKVHGGYVMSWIDEAAYLVSAGWSAGMATAVYSGGIRFYRPILIGHIVEVEARLLHTGRTSMHIAVHVRSGDPRESMRVLDAGQSALQLTTHCLTIFVALDDAGRPKAIPPLMPQTEEDTRLAEHARLLIDLREGRGPAADA